MTKRVVIIGAGPAGMSVATELTRFGIHTTVIDEAPKAGYQSNASFIDLKTQTRVLGPLGESSLLLTHDHKLSNVEYDRLILAMGCYDAIRIKRAVSVITSVRSQKQRCIE